MILDPLPPSLSAKQPSPAINYESFLTDEAKGRYPSPLKDLAAKYLGIPGIINFGGGLPHPTSFPISSLSFNLPILSQTLQIPNSYVPPPNEPYTLSEVPSATLDLGRMLQYGGSSGPEELRNVLKDMVVSQGGVAHANWDLILSCGNTDGLDAIFRLLLPRNSSILVEAFSYPGTLASLSALGVKAIPIAMDGEGLIPSVMDDVLSGWNETVRRSSKPRCMVIVPTGQNPTSVSMGVERRKEVLRVAGKHDLIVICDDPYRSLVIQSPNAPPSNPLPDFLTLDNEGRVLSLSSFSKVVAPGCRIGYIVGPSPLIVKISQRNEVTIQSVSGLGITFLSAFLRALGGMDGWKKYLVGVSEGYSVRATRMHNLFQTHLPLDWVEWQFPHSGMFIFLRIKAEKVPHIQPSTLQATLFDAFIQHKVILTPSSVFRPLPSSTNEVVEVKPTEIFFRASYSFADEAQMEEGVKRLGQALRIVLG